MRVDVSGGTSVTLAEEPDDFVFAFDDVTDAHGPLPGAAVGVTPE